MEWGGGGDLNRYFHCKQIFMKNTFMLMSNLSLLSLLLVFILNHKTQSINNAQLIDMNETLFRVHQSNCPISKRKHWICTLFTRYDNCYVLSCYCFIWQHLSPSQWLCIVGDDFRLRFKCIHTGAGA